MTTRADKPMRPELAAIVEEIEIAYAHELAAISAALRTASQDGQMTPTRRLLAQLAVDFDVARAALERDAAESE